MFTKKESDEVYRALVSDLAYSTVPTAIMGLAIVLIGAHTYSLIPSAGLLVATGFGGLASAAKLVLLRHHRRFNESIDQSMSDVRRLEIAHHALTLCVALSVGTVSALIFADPVVSAHLVATALLFAYCSGVVCRLSYRPRIARSAVFVASALSLGSIVANGDTSHFIVAIVFLILALAANETIVHLYSNARKHITVRLQMETLAHRDPLTALPNRLALREAFDSLPRAAGEFIAVHAFDLDGFKAVNDRHGHPVGDELLSLVAARLETLLNKTDIAARIGGDEFVLVQTGVRRIVEVEQRARHVHDVLTQPYRIRDLALTVGVSLGYSVQPATDADLNALLIPADAASYSAKRHGGGFQPGVVQLGGSLEVVLNRRSVEQPA